MAKKPQSRALEVPAGFETAPDARKARKTRAKRLEKSPNVGVHRLGERLRKCKMGRRCESGACPSCLRLFRLQWLRQVRQVLRGAERVYSVSLVPRDCQVQIGDFDNFELPTVLARECRALQREVESSGWIVIGGVDVSLNTFNNADPHWQAHLYFAVGTPEEVTKKDVVRAFARRGDRAASERPLVVQHVRDGGLARVISYILKSRFYKRSRYVDLSRATPTTNTRHEALAARDDLELALFLNRIGVRGRLIMVGVRRTWPKGRLRLTATKASTL